MMADAVRINVSAAYAANGNLTAPTTNFSQSVASFIPNGYACVTESVTASIALTVPVPSLPGATSLYVAFFVDDLVNPQQMIATPTGTVVIVSRFSVGIPFIHYFLTAPTSFSIVNNGTGTTKIRLFFWN